MQKRCTPCEYIALKIFFKFCKISFIYKWQKCFIIYMKLSIQGCSSPVVLLTDGILSWALILFFWKDWSLFSILYFSIFLYDVQTGILASSTEILRTRNISQHPQHNEIPVMKPKFKAFDNTCLRIIITPPPNAPEIYYSFL